jgi:hypothetical protein
MKKLITAAILSIGLTGAALAKDIVDTAVAAGNFKTLATALQAAGLIDTLKGKGPFTVFAPTDAAFAKIPKDQLEALLKDKAAQGADLPRRPGQGDGQGRQGRQGQDGSGQRVDRGHRRWRDG